MVVVDGGDLAAQGIDVFGGAVGAGDEPEIAGIGRIGHGDGKTIAQRVQPRPVAGQQKEMSPVEPTATEVIDLAIEEVASTERWTVPQADSSLHEDLVDQAFEEETEALLQETNLAEACDLNS